MIKIFIQCGINMKVVIVNGSARGKKGITHRLLGAFEKGLIDSGCVVRSYDLNELAIGHCRSCFHCMHDNPGICAVRDDMVRIYEDLKKSDILVIGTPVYTDSMSSRMKVFFDRCIASMEPFIHEDDQGRFRHSFTWRMPKHFILVATSGFPEIDNFKALESTVRAQAYNFGSDYAASLFVSGSLGFQMDISLLDARLELIYQAGAEFGTKKSISKDLIERINACVFSRDEFYDNYLKYEKWCRQRLSKHD